MSWLGVGVKYKYLTPTPNIILRVFLFPSKILGFTFYE